MINSQLTALSESNKIPVRVHSESKQNSDLKRLQLVNGELKRQNEYLKKKVKELEQYDYTKIYERMVRLEQTVIEQDKLIEQNKFNASTKLQEQNIKLQQQIKLQEKPITHNFANPKQIKQELNNQMLYVQELYNKNEQLAYERDEAITKLNFYKQKCKLLEEQLDGMSRLQYTTNDASSHEEYMQSCQEIIKLLPE
ncbi:hypothetical protein pb186bvf_006470 [Paramecium bursaria]